MWTIYKRPADFPNSFVVRRYSMTPGRVQGDALDFALAPSLDAARLWLPPGLYRLERDPEDDPCIVETWV